MSLFEAGRIYTSPVPKGLINYWLLIVNIFYETWLKIIEGEEFEPDVGFYIFWLSLSVNFLWKTSYRVIAHGKSEFEINFRFFYDFTFETVNK